MIWRCYYRLTILCMVVIIVRVRRDIMRRLSACVLSLVILCFVSVALYGCNNVNVYTLTIDVENDLLYEPLGKSYTGGEKVVVKTRLIDDAETIATINGEPLQYKPVKENGKYTHGEFTFIMPNMNSTLVLKTKDGSSSIPTEINSKVAYYNFTLGFCNGLRLNAYVPSLQDWENVKQLSPAFKSDYNEDFFKRKALLVLIGERGTCEDRQIKSVNVTLCDYTLTVTVSANQLDFGTAVPTAMANWIVVLEIENNLAFSDIKVNAYF